MSNVAKAQGVDFNQVLVRFALWPLSSDAAGAVAGIPKKNELAPEPLAAIVVRLRAAP